MTVPNLEPACWAYRSVRTKDHGMGPGSHLRAIKSALMMFSASNGFNRTRLSRLAFWLAIHGTPRLRPVTRSARS